MGSSACHLDLRRKEEPGEMLNMTGAKPQPPCVWLHDQHHGTGALGTLGRRMSKCGGGIDYQMRPSNWNRRDF